jgi:hypothetical protein
MTQYGKTCTMSSRNHPKQKCDGIHKLSDAPAIYLAELHENIIVEYFQASVADALAKLMKKGNTQDKILDQLLAGESPATRRGASNLVYDVHYV